MATTTNKPAAAQAKAAASAVVARYLPLEKTLKDALALAARFRDAEGFRWRTRAQIEEGRSWIWRDDGTILFKAEASAWTPAALQLQQVWVDPSARGRRYAQRGLRDLCTLLLGIVPSVCLFVRPENAPAIRVYEAIGMQHVHSYRSVIF